MVVRALQWPENWLTVCPVPRQGPVFGYSRYSGTQLRRPARLAACLTCPMYSPDVYAHFTSTYKHHQHDHSYRDYATIQCANGSIVAEVYMALKIEQATSY